MEERNLLGWTGVTLLGSAFGSAAQEAGRDVGLNAWFPVKFLMVLSVEGFALLLCQVNAFREICFAGKLPSSSALKPWDGFSVRLKTRAKVYWGQRQRQPWARLFQCSCFRLSRTSCVTSSSIRCLCYQAANKAPVGWPAFWALLKEIYTGCKYQLQHWVHLQMPKWTKININVFISNGISLTYKCNIAPVMWVSVFWFALCIF